jgi:hypothetical protein
MPKELQSSFTVGKTRFTHAGFGVYKLTDLNSPTDRLSGPTDSAKKAVEIAEAFGVGYGAFRMVRSSVDLEAKELLSRDSRAEPFVWTTT